MAEREGFEQIEVIAQGLLQCLAVLNSRIVCRQFGSWLRTVRSEILSSEQVVAIALRHSVSDGANMYPGWRFENVSNLVRSGGAAGSSEATRGSCVASPDGPQTRALSLRDEDCIEGTVASGKKTEG